MKIYINSFIMLHEEMIRVECLLKNKMLRTCGKFLSQLVCVEVIEIWVKRFINKYLILNTVLIF